ncbi:hypothetical protein FANTH_12230 [Fusarium anthophilum]|uniref:Uncharacterized protein n=1 Tax=Fusarium anthophilum TaxID=48485 RepID=A0A8H4YU25_9HYPO|nr:hypothetical protein FANTH_12230 [Fusarium anthophilum]
MDTQNLDAAFIYIICENFCLHCREGRGDHQDFPSVSAAQDTDAKTLRYTLVSLSTVCRSWGYIAQKTLHHHFGFAEATPQAERLKTLDIKNKTVRETGIYNPLNLPEGSIGGFIAALPNLQSLEAVNPSRQTLRDPLQFLNVRRIALRSTILSKEGLRLLISATGPLEYFLYTGAYCFGDNFCSIQDICEILALRKDTLKVLIAVPAHTAYDFTAGRRLLNVQHIRMALEDIWLPVLDDDIRDDQILVRGLPPCLETAYFDTADNILEDLLDAVITYIQSSYRKDPKDQVLKIVHILVCMYSDRKTTEQSPDSIHNSALKLIQEKCGDFLKHGKVDLRAVWADCQDEDSGNS